MGVVSGAAALLLLCGGASALVASPSLRRCTRTQCRSTATAETTTRVELTAAELARTAAELGISAGAALSTIGREMSGAPFTSYVDYVLDGEGSPVILLKSGAEHSLNLDADDRASVLLRGGQPVGDGEAFGAALPRVTIAGKIERIPLDDPDYSIILSNFGVCHTYSEELLRDKSDEFVLHRFSPMDSVFYVGGFGVQASWIDVEDFSDSTADVVAKDAATLVAKLNGDPHTSDIRIVATHLLGVPEDRLVSSTVSKVDRLGMDIRVVTRDQGAKNTEEFRVAFRCSARSLEDAKSEVMKLLQEAWEMDRGMTWEGAYDQKPIVKKLQ